jgi:hypothetical protein
MNPIPTTKLARSSKKSEPICMYLRELIIIEGKGGDKCGRIRPTTIGGWTEF